MIKYEIVDKPGVDYSSFIMTSGQFVGVEFHFTTVKLIPNEDNPTEFKLSFNYQLETDTPVNHVLFEKDAAVVLFDVLEKNTFDFGIS